MKSICRALTVLCLAANAAAAAPAPEPPAQPPPLPFTATYVAKFNGLPVEAHRQLAVGADQQYQLTTAVGNVLGELTEDERFHLDARGAIQVDSYQSRKAVFGVTRVEQLTVDHDRNSARYQSKKRTREIPLRPGYLGPVSYQLQLARDLDSGAPLPSYQVIDRGKLKDYRFEVVGEETLATPLGAIRTLKLRRVRDNQERETLFWLAPAWHFLVVKLWQREEDGQNYELTLSAATVNGQALPQASAASPAAAPTGAAAR